MSKLKNLIKWGNITLPDSDSDLIPRSQVKSIGSVPKKVANLFPYGITANAPKDTDALILSVQGNEENGIAIPVAFGTRFTGLKPGEVVVGSPAFKNKISFKETGGTELNGAEFEGLIKIVNLTSKINNYVTEFNSFITVFNTHQHPETGTTTGIPLTPGSNATTFDRADYENDTIKHGTVPTTTAPSGGGIAHTDLIDMPSAVNADHDGRYFTEIELGKTTPITGASLIGISSGVAPTFGKTNVQDALDSIDITVANTREPTGFIQTLDNKAPASSTLSFVNGNRTFTIEPSSGFSDFTFYVLGKRFIKSSPESKQISDVEGLHYIYYDSLGILRESISETELNFNILPFTALVTIIYWDKTNQLAIYFAEERHFNSMSGSTHALNHLTRGTQFISGDAIKDILTDQSGDLASHAQFGTEAGETRDEDMRNVAGGIQSTVGFPVFYKSGAGGDWRRGINSGFPILTIGTGRMAWNEFIGGAHQLSEVGNNDLALIHIFHTNDKAINDYHIVVLGQDTYKNIIDARNGANVEINNLVTSGLPFVEFVPIATVIYQTANSYGNAVKSRTRTTDLGTDWIDWRTSGLSPAVSSVNSHLLLADLNAGDGVGNHSNAANLLGRPGGQTLIGGTLTTEKLTLQDNVVDGNTITIGSDVNFGGLDLTNAGTGNFLVGNVEGVTVTSSNSGFYRLMTTAGGANSRNWGIATEFNAEGFFEILRSTTAGGTPSTTAFKLDKDSNTFLFGNLDMQENAIDNVGDITHDDATASDWIFRNEDEDKFTRFFGNEGGVDTELLTLDHAQRFVGIGTSTPRQQLELVKEGANGGIWFGVYSNTANHRGLFNFNRWGGSVASPTAVVNSSILGAFGFNAYNGIDLKRIAELNVRAVGLQSVTNQGSRMQFFTTEENTTTLIERVRISDNGDVGIGTTTPTVKLDVDGDAIFNESGLDKDFRVEALSTVTNLNLPSHALFVNAATGKVGIGTSNPASEFEIETKTGVSANFRITSSANRSFLFQNDVNGNVQMRNLYINGRFSFLVNKGGVNTEVLRIVGTTANVGIGTTSPNANAMLEVASTTRAFLPPRMTTTQMNAIASPVNGMMIYNTTVNAFYGYENGSWVDL